MCVCVCVGVCVWVCVRVCVSACLPEYGGACWLVCVQVAHPLSKIRLSKMNSLKIVIHLDGAIGIFSSRTCILQLVREYLNPDTVSFND